MSDEKTSIVIEVPLEAEMVVQLAGDNATVRYSVRSRNPGMEQIESHMVTMMGSILDTMLDRLDKDDESEKE